MSTAPLLPHYIEFNAHPKDKSAAIAQLARLMASCHLTEPGYDVSLLQRETVASTHLGHGIAVPHGMPAHRHMVRQTGVVILQIPDGLNWDDEVVHLVFGIAADTDAHLPLLQRLTRLLQDPARLVPLFTANRLEPFQQLFGVPEAELPQPPTLDDLPHRFEWHLAYPNGLHARPAGAWVETAKRFDAAIRIRRGTACADGRQLLELLQLGIQPGERLVVSAAGPEAEPALQALRATMLALCRPESEASAPQLSSPISGRQLAGQVIAGIPASPGQATAATWRLRAQQTEVADLPGPLREEGLRLEQALSNARQALSALIEQSTHQPDNGAQGILRAQRLLLEDHALIAECCQRLSQGHGAAWSWQRTIDRRARQLEASDRPMVQARAADLRDIGRRVLAALGEPAQADWIAALPAGRIVIADDLPPSEMARLSPGQIAGLCLADSGPQGHTAILARALELPCMVAAGAALLAVPDGTQAMLDGTRGELTLHPTTGNRPPPAAAEQDVGCALPVTLLANADTPGQWRRAQQLGAQGVGLMRSECLLLRSHGLLDEETQFQIFRAMAEATAGHSLVIRLFDIGSDKTWPSLALAREDNPALGMRGARLLLARPALLEPHLRALYRAAAHGPMSLLIPMISSLEELLTLRDICQAVRLDLRAPQLPIGAMIEVPAAALQADSLAEHADFLSLGTNDLTQYILAMDRQHPQFADCADARHPAVLRLIAQTVQAAQRHGRALSVCGALAGQPAGARLLYGLGIRTLSMPAAEMPSVRAALRGVDPETLAALAVQALAADTLATVRALSQEAS